MIRQHHKKILQNYLPVKYVKREKSGFNPPLESIINKLDYETINKNIVHLSDYVNIDYVRKIIKDHYSNKKNNTYKIWQLMFLESWLRHNS